MPLYEYHCSGCGHRFEVLQKLGEDGSELSCPACGKVGVEKEFSTFAGSGTSDAAADCSPRGGFT